MHPSKIGPITQYVNDFSGMISPEKLSELNQLFQQIESKNLAVKQVVTVIFPHREGKELLDIGIELFNNTGIGEKGVNNGLLLLISSEEKKLRIIVGKGLEFIYTEDWCRDVIENHLRPLLDDGKYAELVETWSEYMNKNFDDSSKKDFHYKTYDTQIYKYDFTKGNDTAINIFIGLFFGYPLFSFFLSNTFPFFAFYFFIFTFVIITIIFLILTTFRKRFSIKGIGSIILIAYFLMIIPGILAFTARQEQECRNNPQICEQQKIKNKAGSSYNSSSHSSDSSSRSSLRSSSSDFGGGGGSTNGAGWGD